MNNDELNNKQKNNKIPNKKMDLNKNSSDSNPTNTINLNTRNSAMQNNANQEFARKRMNSNINNLKGKNEDSAISKLRNRNLNKPREQVGLQDPTSSGVENNSGGPNLSGGLNSLNKIKDKFNPLKGKTSDKKSGNAAKNSLKKAAKVVVKATGKLIRLVVTNPVFLAFMGIFAIIFLVIIAVGGIVSDEDSSSSSSGSKTVCTYNVAGNEYEDLKIRLLDCDTGEPVPGEELVDFEKYVLGVTYGEAINSEQGIKAWSIAIRSFTLTRGEGMGATKYGKIADENGQKVLMIRACTKDQFYCDPDRGCSSSTGSPEGVTVHSGVDTAAKKIRDPLPEDSDYRKFVQETEGQVLKKSDGSVIATPYRIGYNQYCPQGACLEVNMARDFLNKGYDYKQLLMHAYSSKVSGADVGKNCKTVNGGPTSILNADFLWPSDSTTITSIFGYRGACGSGCTAYHDAIDVAGAPKGSPVYNIADGQIVYMGSDWHIIYVYHGTMNGKKVFSRYMHGDYNTKFKVGDTIKKGDIITYESGWGPGGGSAYGTHLDFSAVLMPEDVDNSQVNSYTRSNPLTTFYNLQYDGTSDGRMDVSLTKGDGSTINSLSWSYTNRELLNFKATWCSGTSGPCGNETKTLRESDFQ